MKRFKNKPAGIIGIAELKTTKGKIAYWLMFAVLVIACILSLVPSIWIFMTGLKGSQEIYAHSFFPKELSWADVWQRMGSAVDVMQFWGKSLNTLILTVGDVILTLLICGLGGYVISRLKPRGTKLFFALVVWTMMMPAQIRTVPLFISFLNFPFVAEFPWEVNLMNSYVPLWLSTAANCFNIILFKNHFDSISISYVEAAKIDGCTNAGIFFKIMLPLSVPTMAFVSIMTTKVAWSDFFLGYLVLTDQAVQTLPVRIFVLSSASSVKQNTYMLCLTLACLPMLILYVFFHRMMIGGVNVGGVKG